MRIQKIRHMIRRLQLRAFRMTERATVRQINLVVTHQAIRHLRHIGATNSVRFLKPAMASLAGIGGIQKRPNLGPIPPKISPLIDRPRNHRSNVPQLQMLSVTEFLKRRSRSLRKQTTGCRRQDAGGRKQEPPQTFPERHPPPAACRLPPATCHLPPASCRLPPAACRLPPATCHLPPATCHLPPASCRLPPAACRLPPILCT